MLSGGYYCEMTEFKQKPQHRKTLVISIKTQSQPSVSFVLVLLSIALCLSVGAKSRLRRGTISPVSTVVQCSTVSSFCSLSAPVECLNYQELERGEESEEGEESGANNHIISTDNSRILHLVPSYVSPPVSCHVKNIISDLNAEKSIHSALLDLFKPTFPHPRQSRSLGVKVVIFCLTEPRPARHCDPVWSIIIAQQAQVTADQDQTREQPFHDFYH